MNRSFRAALALSGALALSAPAASASAAPNQVDSSAPLFTATRIVPGWSETATLRVHNDSAGSADVSIATADIVDDENGCNRSESAVDPTCDGSNAGELGHELQVTIADTDVSSVPLVGLASAHPLGSLAAGATSSYEITLALPVTSGNETQSDRVGFDLKVLLNGRPSTEVEGLKVTRGGSGLTALLNRLPFTGPPPLRLVAAGFALLTVGAMLWAMGARRRLSRSA